MKKSFFIVLFFASVSMIFAKGLELDVGGVYTNHQLHTFDNTKTEGFNVHTNKSKHMGGISSRLSYFFDNHWSIFCATSFAFNEIFANDSMLGFGYTFGLDKGFKLFLGGGFAFGGSVFKWAAGGTTTKFYYTNIGGGLRLVASYMFTRQFGMYVGLADSYYAAVAGKKKTITGSTVTETTLNSNARPDMVKSLSVQLGLKIKL